MYYLTYNMTSTAFHNVLVQVIEAKKSSSQTIFDFTVFQQLFNFKKYKFVCSQRSMFSSVIFVRPLKFISKVCRIVYRVKEMSQPGHQHIQIQMTSLNIENCIGKTINLEKYVKKYFNFKCEFNGNVITVVYLHLQVFGPYNYTMQKKPYKAH